MLDSYDFLRRLENRLQMYADGQTHLLPTDALQRGKGAAHTHASHVSYTIIDDQGRRPPAKYVYDHLLALLQANPDDEVALADLAGAEERGELTMHMINVLLKTLFPDEK